MNAYQARWIRGEVTEVDSVVVLDHWTATGPNADTNPEYARLATVVFSDGRHGVVPVRELVADHWTDLLP